MLAPITQAAQCQDGGTAIKSISAAKDVGVIHVSSGRDQGGTLVRTDRDYPLERLAAMIKGWSNRYSGPSRDERHVGAWSV